MAAGHYFRTEAAEDVAGSIRHVLRCAVLSGEDPQAWKWAMLALHSALQGACVCHLATTAAPLGAVSERNAKEWVNYFETSRDNPDLIAPKTYLMDLPDLLKAVQKPQSAGGGPSESPIEISAEEFACLRRFHKTFRNQFVHFEPLGWSIEVSDVPQIGQLIARIVKEIYDCGWAFRHLDTDSSDALEHDLERLKEAAWPLKLE